MYFIALKLFLGWAEVCICTAVIPYYSTTSECIKVNKGAKMRYLYNQVQPDPGYQWELTNSQLDTTNENQEASPFPAGDHTAHINIHVQRHSRNKTEVKKHKRSTKEVPTWNGQ